MWMIIRNSNNNRKNNHDRKFTLFCQKNILSKKLILWYSTSIRGAARQFSLPPLVAPTPALWPNLSPGWASRQTLPSVPSYAGARISHINVLSFTCSRGKSPKPSPVFRMLGSIMPGSALYSRATWETVPNKFKMEWKFVWDGKVSLLSYAPPPRLSS